MNNHLVGALEHEWFIFLIHTYIYTYIYIYIYLECHHPNWRSLIFFRGVAVQPPVEHGRLWCDLIHKQWASLMGWTMDEPAVISWDEHGDLYIAPIYLWCSDWGVVSLWHCEKPTWMSRFYLSILPRKDTSTSISLFHLYIPFIPRNGGIYKTFPVMGG